MNLFSSLPFLESLAEVHFPGQPHALVDCEVEGSRYRLPKIGQRVITEWPFLDFFEPEHEPEKAQTVSPLSLKFLPHVVTATVPAEGKKPDAVTPGLQPAPFIRWAAFPEWPAFETQLNQRRKQLLADTRRQTRHLSALGELVFVYDDARPAAFETCARWKSAQYMATGIPDKFFQDNLELFRALQRKGVLVVSTLSVGEKIVAAHIGACWEGRFYYWIPAYDSDHGKLSPGRVLLMSLLKECHARGHREFDFLLGDEDYKWHYATDCRVVGPVGQPPMSLTLKKRFRGQAKRALSRFPRLLALAKKWFRA